MQLRAVLFVLEVTLDRMAILAGWACESTFTKHCKGKQPLDNLLPQRTLPCDPEGDLELSALEDEEIEADKRLFFVLFLSLLHSCEVCRNVTFGCLGDLIFRYVVRMKFGSFARLASRFI